MSDQTFSMGTTINAGNAQAEQATVSIKDTDTRNFVPDVIEASKEVPVIVDFWAPWCGPCKQLMPVLEKIVAESGGKVQMVKVNIDENQQLAQQMRIQSVPAVFAFANGQPVDGFMGAVPESEIRAFVKKLISAHGNQASQIDDLLEAGDQAMSEEDYSKAAELYDHACQLAPDNARALASMVKVHIAAGDIDGAQNYLAAIPEDLSEDPHVSGAKAALELALVPADDGELSKLHQAIAADESDFQSRLDLSVALNAAGQREEALDHVMWLIEKDRNWNDEAARKQLLQFFEAWGPTDELTLSGRRRLSSILFA